MAITVQNSAVSGWATAVGLAKEATFGTAVAPTIYLPIESATFTGTNKLITRNPVRRSKANQQPGFGSFDMTGSIDIRLDPVSCAPILGLCLGTETTSVSGSGTAHVYTMGAQSTATVSADFGRNSVAQFLGCKFDSLDISAKAGDDVMIKATVIGQTESLLTSQSLTPSVTNVTPFEWAFITACTIDGTAVDMTDFDVQLKNNLKAMITSSSGRFPRAINELGADVTGSFTVPYQSDAINALLWGASSGPATGTVAGHTIVITFTHPTIIAGTTPYSLTITINNANLESAPTPISAKNEVMQQVKFSAAESSAGAADALTVRLVNGTSSAFV